MELVLFRIFICDFVEVMVGTLIKVRDDTKWGTSQYTGGQDCRDL